MTRRTFNVTYVFKAGEGTRTLDMQLGRLPLYQLSYARVATIVLLAG